MSNPQGPDAQSSGESRDPATVSRRLRQQSRPWRPTSDPERSDPTRCLGGGSSRPGGPRSSRSAQPQPPQAPQQPQTAPQAPQQPQVPPQPQQGAPGSGPAGRAGVGSAARRLEPAATAPGGVSSSPRRPADGPSSSPRSPADGPSSNTPARRPARGTSSSRRRLRILPPDQQQAWGQQQPAGWGQQPCGQPPGQPPQQQAPWAPPGSQPTDGAGKKSRAPLIVLAVVVAVLVAVGIVGFVTPGLLRDQGVRHGRRAVRRAEGAQHRLQDRGRGGRPMPGERAGQGR